MLRMTVIALILGNVMLAGYRAAYRPPVQAAATVPSRPLPADLAGITLMHELESGRAGQGDPHSCYSAGPFETAASRQRARALLENGALLVRDRDTEALMELGYWVALPPFSGLAEAVDTERELRRTGLEDVAVVTDEEHLYRVSLGYFLDENNALQRRDEVRELGYFAQTRLQRESQPRYWLDYEMSPGADPDTQALQAAFGPGLHRSIPCQAMAGTTVGAADPNG